MIELGDPMCAPPRFRAGSIVPGTRWLVVRHATPAQRNVGRPLWQARVVVRCVCGTQRIVWEWDLVHGRSRGCPSAACRRVSARSEVVMAAVDKAIEEQLASLVSEREQRRERIRAQADQEIRAIDEEIDAVRRTLELMASRKGRRAS